MCRIFCLLESLVLLLSPAAFADGTINGELDLLSQHGVHTVPSLSERQLEKLASGQPVVFLHDDGGAESIEHAVYAVDIIEAPRILVWLAMLGGTGERDTRYDRATIERDAIGGSTRYQYFDLPWPIRDRHWVIRLQKNLRLADATDGRAWQHRWSLVDDVPNTLEVLAKSGEVAGLTERRIEQSIVPATNEGALSAIELDEDRTLVVAWFHIDLGGRIPKSLVQSVSGRELRKSMYRFEDFTSRVHATYTADPILHDGFGRAIMPLDAQPVIGIY